jgi:hypothetical protein
MRHVGKRSFRSFERKHSNTLWQMDYTQLQKDGWVLQIVDDHSRFIIGAKVVLSPDGDETTQLLKGMHVRFRRSGAIPDRPRNLVLFGQRRRELLRPILPGMERPAYPRIDRASAEAG